jgi:hypothetical protein
MEKIGQLKLLLHGRQRKRIRMAMSERIKDMEFLLAAKKLGRLIQRLLPDYTEPLDFNQLKDRNGTPLPTPAAADKAASRTMRDWMDIPPNLNSIANSFELLNDLWIEVLRGLFCTVTNPIPNDVQQAILHASQERPLSPKIKMDFHLAMNTPFTFQEFEHYRRHLSVGKSPGPSGLTTTQIRHWGPTLLEWFLTYPTSCGITTMFRNGGRTA